jgi:PqqD family protein of HPr-rel-A system
VNLTSPAEPLWVALDSGHCDSHRWGDETVVYVLATGETHALGPGHSAVLDLLLESPGSARAARQWLALLADDGERQDAADLAAIRSALIDLHRIGVVERRPT